MHNFNVEFLSDKDMYQAYMPFIKTGGIFIKTPQSYDLGAEATLEVTLPDSLEPSIVTGKICWSTPVGAQNGTPAGVGVCFEDDPDNIRSQIEKAIGRLLSSSEPTLSM